MERNKKNSNFQFDISNLIDNAVNNALARRNQNQDLEDALLTLSDEEMANVAGGIASVASVSLVKEPIIAGGISVKVPITCGIIAQNNLI
ncbi:hypothetical protein [Nostoc sp. ChiQUE01b]|uniref:hypothetical protein n=1 Tax=Nostoc sp. ChiQUE01b TaxID=3075376 RepID=UPI002AD3D631|nr:hypothetical protein [Nostoc sp. ChiQUE01b]MDZ8262443.1 hypothetical protein [Nostoc sp. ChiQUE01b]